MTAAVTRLRLSIAYDGTDISGWARQPGRRTVQGVLEDALQRIMRLPVALTVAGRTDAGVHATGQVAHGDVPGEVWESLAPSMIRRLAGVLPADVRVPAIDSVDPEFDARFDALWRRYVYRVTDGPAGPDPLRRRETLAWARRLDEQAMQRAADGLVGEHDFAAYCRRREGASTVRTLRSLQWTREHELLTVTVQADAFCHQMVRSLVGAMLAVGDGRRPEDWPAALLALRQRSDAVMVAAPHGLMLVAVGYPSST